MMKALIGMGKIIVAIDSFKGCLTSAEANRAAAEGILSQMSEAEVIQIPVSDGGEGWLEAVYSAMGGRMQDVLVNDPLMRPIVAQYLINGDTAVIEMAKASGLNKLWDRHARGRCRAQGMPTHHRGAGRQRHKRLWHGNASSHHR